MLISTVLDRLSLKLLQASLTGCKAEPERMVISLQSPRVSISERKQTDLRCCAHTMTLSSKASLQKYSLSRGCIHRAFISRINTNETLVFLNTWFSHPKDLVFCALTKAIHKDLWENQVFQVRGFFLLGFCLVLDKQAIVWFSSDCLHLL